MQITVAICTRDRSASLARTLSSLEHVTPPDCSWELLVIDNACSDDTRDVIAGFAGRLPIRTEFEPRPGLSHARNRAMASARGRYLVGTDDDVLVEAGWLRAYRAAFARWPDAALFAGRIVPVLQEPVTDWFARHKAKLGYPLAARDMGDRPIALSLEADRHPFGANYAVRTEIQRLFPFDGELGAGTSHFGEEVTVFKAMLAAGHSGRWLPDCRVEHLIGPERQTRSYV